MTTEQIAITSEQLSILTHTLLRGGRAKGQKLYCGEDENVLALEKKGLMEYAGKVSFVPDPFYRLTPKGEKLAIEYRKATL